MRAECAGTGMGHTSHSAWYLSSISRRKSLRWVPFGASAFEVIVRKTSLQAQGRTMDAKAMHAARVSVFFVSWNPVQGLKQRLAGLKARPKMGQICISFAGRLVRVHCRLIVLASGFEST